MLPELHLEMGTVITRLSCVDGEAGELLIRGYPIEELAGHISYEEVLYLLWWGYLPHAEQLASLKTLLNERRALPPLVLNVLHETAKQGLTPIEALRSAASLLELPPTAGRSREMALTVVAAFPTIIAAYARLLESREPLPPQPELSHVANYLYMLWGREATPEQVAALETYLVTVCDHGVSASTFAARVIVSTGSDLLSAIVGAVGALKGHLHGGAPGPALDMLLGIDKASQAESYLRAKLERGERLMGFGHRDYKVCDPRAVILEAAAERLSHSNGGADLYALAKHVETAALHLLEEYKPGRRLNTNLEFWVAVLLHGVVLPSSLFTPTFAAARTAGWAAHCFEQAELGRMIQPRTIYAGEQKRYYG